MIVSHANHLVSNGHDVTLQAHKIDTIFPLDPKVRIIQMSWGGKVGTLATAMQSLGLYDAIIADIIPVALLLTTRNRQAVVYYAQDYDESYYSILVQKLFIRCLYYLGLGILKIRTISVSAGLSQIFLNRYGHSSIVVENGVDLGIFHRNPDEDLLALKGTNKSILILSRSDWRKGFDLACEVVDRLSRISSTPFEVWSVGEQTKGLSKAIIHRDLGYLSGESLARVLSSADIFLYPSRHEGFPLMIVEAFACGCPVVTTDAVCFAHDGENALVVPVEDVGKLVDACNTLLSDPDAGLTLARSAASFARKHELTDTLKNFESALETNLGLSFGQT